MDYKGDTHVPESRHILIELRTPLPIVRHGLRDMCIALCSPLGRSRPGRKHARRASSRGSISVLDAIVVRSRNTLVPASALLWRKLSPRFRASWAMSGGCTRH